MGFFKPTISKIVTFILLFYVFPYIIRRFVIVGLGGIFFVVFLPSYWFTLLLILLNPKIDIRFLDGAAINIIDLLLNLVTYYLISCLLVFLAHKLKGQKTK